MRNLTNNIFRKLIVLLLIAGPIACGKDDGPSEPSKEELIIGKWFVTNIFPNAGGPSEALDNCAKKSFFEFGTNNLVTEGGFYLDGSECKGSLKEHEYTLSPEGEKLILTSTIDGTTATMNILTLDRTTLVIDLVSPPFSIRMEKR